jgi:hypothetical protein
MRLRRNFGPFDPYRQMQMQQMQMQAVRTEQIPNGTPPKPVDEPEVSAEVDATAPSTEEATQSATPAPAPEATSTQPITRSASTPGLARLPAQSRSHSPAPSNVSFHGNGHPRRAGRAPFPGNANGNGNGNGNGAPATNGRAASAAPAQRVPNADEFPALGPKGSSSVVRKEWDGKTAAQVLAEPAPVIAEPTKEASGDKETGDKASQGKSESDGEVSVTNVKRGRADR